MIFRFRTAKAIAPAATGIIAIMLVAGCGGADSANNVAANEAAGEAAPASDADESEPSGNLAGNETAEAAPQGDMPNRSGPTRQARCAFNDEAEQDCSFTPVLGDGSFEVETSDRQVRMVVDGNTALPFEVFGPERRVPLPGSLTRDAADNACWVAEDRELPLYRLCAR